MGSRVATTATRSACIRNEDLVDFADDGGAITSFAFAWTQTQGATNDGSKIDVRGKYRKVEKLSPFIVTWTQSKLLCCLAARTLPPLKSIEKYRRPSPWLKFEIANGQEEAGPGKGEGFSCVA